MSKRIVSVWLDDVSDEHGWIVDTDTDEGGESGTLKVFPPTDDGFERAVTFAKRAALKRGCDVHVCNGVSKIILKAEEVAES